MRQVPCFLHFKGRAEGGPFDGCDIDSDTTVVQDSMFADSGAYHFSGGKWIWITPSATRALVTIFKDLPSREEE